MSDEAQCRACRFRVCAAIPHHDNLRCRRRDAVAPAPPWPRIGIVGTGVRVAPELAPLRRHATLVGEPRHRHLCEAFYDTLDVAIAWRKPDRYRPAERFTNPLAYGIPTIGHSHFATFAHYRHAGPFLCATAACVAQRLRGLRNGSLLAAFRALRDEVRLDVDPAHVAHTHTHTAFALATHTNTSRRALAPLA